MAANSPIPLTAGAFQKWRKQYPQAADDLIKIVNLVYAMELSLIAPGTSNRGPGALLTSPDKYSLVLPIKFRARIAHSAATAASASATVNAMLDEFSASTINP